MQSSMQSRQEAPPRRVGSERWSGSAPRRGVRLGAVLLSALLYAAAFPPLGLWPLAWCALVPLLLVVRTASPGRAAAWGVAWTVFATLALVGWLPGALARFFGIGDVAGWLSALGIGLWTSLPYALWAAAVAHAARRGVTSPWLCGAGFALAEWARTHAPLPSPYGLVAYSQLPGPFAQLADLAGPWGIAALIASGNAALASLWLARRAPRLAARPPLFARLATPLGVGLVVLLALAWALVRERSDFGRGPEIRVAAVHSGVVRNRTWQGTAQADRRSQRLGRYLELTLASRRHEPELVFWPEFAVDFYVDEATLPAARTRSLVRSLGVELVLGSARRAPGQDGAPRLHNSVFLIDARGRVAARHDKRALVPFAESAPLGHAFAADTARYAPGERVTLLPAERAEIGAFLCAEALFPSVARSMVVRGATLLANPSNDYWLGSAAGAEQQLQVAALRAIENRRWLVRTTPSGATAVIDPHGRVRARSLGGGAQVVPASVREATGWTPWLELGDGGAAALLICVAVAPWVRRRDTNPGGDP